MLNKYNITLSDFGLSYTVTEISDMLSEIIAKIEQMQTDVYVLPSLIKNFKLRFKICVMLSLTNSVIKKLKRSDVLQKTPRLGAFVWCKSLIQGIIKAIRSKPFQQGRIL